MRVFYKVVHITSVADESLVSYRVEATYPKRWGHILHSDESKWQDVEIFPVTRLSVIRMERSSS